MPRCIECGVYQSSGALYCAACSRKRKGIPAEPAPVEDDRQQGAGNVYRMHGVVLAALGIALFVVSLWLDRARGGGSKAIMVPGFFLLLIGVVETIRGRSSPAPSSSGQTNSSAWWDRRWFRFACAAVIVALVALLVYLVIDVYQSERRAEDDQ